MGLIALAMFHLLLCFGSSSQDLRGWVRRSLGTPVDLRLVRLRWVDVESPWISDSPLVSNSPSSVYLAPDVVVLGLFSGGLAPLGPESTGLKGNPITVPTIRSLRG